MKDKLVPVLAGLTLLFASAGVAFATSPATYHIDITPDTGPDYVANVTAPTFDGHTVYLLGFDPTTGAPTKYYINNGITNSAGQLDVFDVQSSAIQGLDNFKSDTNTSLNSLWGNLAFATSTSNAALSSLSAALATFGAPLNIAVFMGTNASTSPYVASSTQNGFMSTTDKIKLDGLVSKVMATSTRSIVTGTGATGFQVSATRDADVRYSSTIVTTSTIAGSQSGTLVLEIAPVNSATSTVWSEVGRCTNGTAYTLAVAIQGVSTQACQITGYLPAGYYAKLRSINNSGTPSFTYNSGQEILQ